MTNTNYNKMSQKNKEAVESIEPIVPQPAEVEETTEPVMLKGVVSGCDKLYVRAEASTDSEPLGIINCDTELVVCEFESTEDFYSVCTETGLTGFCMKKFISIL